VHFLHRIAERRILEAIERGDLDRLEGRGRPLRLDDDSAVPEGWRAAYRVLKNAGVVPPEVELRREIAALERLIGGKTLAPGARSHGLERLALLRTALAARTGRESSVGLETAYREKIQRRLGRR